MARTRMTIRRVDPWSILKFGFVANLVLLGIQLLAGAVVWYVIQRLELIETVCELAGTVGFEECGVDGGALFDTFLVLGLLGVVIQTGILVFLTFLANLIFDLTGGIVLTLEDDRPARARGATRTGGGASFSGTTTRASNGGEQRPERASSSTPPPPLGTDSASTDSTSTSSRTSSAGTSGDDAEDATASSSSGSDDDTLFGSS